MGTKTAVTVRIFGRHLYQLKNLADAQQLIPQIGRIAAKPRLYTTESNPEQTATTMEKPAPPSSAEIDRLMKELAEAKEQNSELLDKYKRSLAESENIRARLNKQITDAKNFGIQNFCRDLLDVADNLGHATQAVPKDKLAYNADLKNLFEGLVMTKASLMQVFKRHGLEPFNPINEKFNPNFHEALFEKEDSTVEANTIVDVTKLGYILHTRCIRPALVGVSK
ncbi:grpE protein homolog, mitochondrial-like [Drosophila tropicalis]|uniref:grpE protein homolog, mitochondrial-like n=1 Tax=Drosophila tropicalis TaxID=46794 RepID=UPI0035ABAA83